MLREELKKRAISMVQIPNHFQPLIEEYVERENGEGEAMFSWINEEQDEGITIDMDLSGNLTGLLIDNNDKNSDVIPLNIEKKENVLNNSYLAIILKH